MENKMNKIVLIGRVVAKPELSKTSNDRSYVRTKLAVNRKYKNSDGNKEADFIPVVLWGKSAEFFASYAKKGSLVSVEGNLRVSAYEDKHKQKQYDISVQATGFDLLESRAAVALREGNSLADEMVLEEEELPF